jgi:hypothetical protein
MRGQGWSSGVVQVKHFIASIVPGGATVPVLRKAEILWPMYASGQPVGLWSYERYQQGRWSSLTVARTASISALEWRGWAVVPGSRRVGSKGFPWLSLHSRMGVSV